MNILILGAYDSVNLGDPVICECVAAMLQRNFPDAHITIRDVISRDRHRAFSDIGIKTLEKRRIKMNICRFSSRYLGIDLTLRTETNRFNANRRHLEQIFNVPCDLVVFAGGQMFMDRYALFLEACILHFQKQGIPVILNACGTGPAHSRTIAKRLKHALMQDCVKHISCRDDVHKVNLLYLEKNKKAIPTYDAALSSYVVYTNAYNKEETHTKDTVGLGVIYPNGVSFHKSLRFWRRVIRQLEKQNIPWKIFSNGDSIDLEFARKILSTMPEFSGLEDTCICPRDVEPEGLVHTISEFSSLISFRLHSHIIAASLDIPTVAIVWDEKVPFFFKKIGCSERCFTVDASAEEVVLALHQAKKKGYDRTLLTKQAAHSEKQLVDAVRRVLTEGGIS